MGEMGTAPDAAAQSLADVATELVKDARLHRGKGPAFRIFEGWSFGLSFGPVMPTPEVFDRFKDSVAARLGAGKLLAGMTYDEFSRKLEETRSLDEDLGDRWIFSASLYPRGRGSTEKDWRLLGVMCAAVGAPRDSLQTPFETTNPNDVHYWMWSEEKSS